MGLWLGILLAFGMLRDGGFWAVVLLWCCGPGFAASWGPGGRLSSE